MILPEKIAEEIKTEEESRQQKLQKVNVETRIVKPECHYRGLLRISLQIWRPLLKYAGQTNLSSVPD